MAVYYVKSRGSVRGRFRHLPDVKPYATIEAAAEKVTALGGPSNLIAIFDDKGNRYEQTETGHWRS